MKKLFLIVVIALRFVISGQAQQTYLAPKTYISIASDSLISKQKLLNGFRICLSDTTYRVTSFEFTYECGKDICTIPGKGAGLDTALSLFKTTIHMIPIKSLVTIEGIKVEKNGRFLQLPSILLFVTD